MTLATFRVLRSPPAPVAAALDGTAQLFHLMDKKRGALIHIMGLGWLMVSGTTDNWAHKRVRHQKKLLAERSRCSQ